MINKCAKFHGHIQSSDKVKFNLASTIELSETPVLCTTLYRHLTQASNVVGALDQLFPGIFYAIFTEDMSLLLLYRRAKEYKMTKTQIKGCPAIKVHMGFAGIGVSNGEGSS